MQHLLTLGVLGWMVRTLESHQKHWKWQIPVAKDIGRRNTGGTQEAGVSTRRVSAILTGEPWKIWPGVTFWIPWGWTGIRVERSWVQAKVIGLLWESVIYTYLCRRLRRSACHEFRSSVAIRDFPDHATFREKGAKLSYVDKLGVFLSLTVCKKANFEYMSFIK